MRWVLYFLPRADNLHNTDYKIPYATSQFGILIPYPKSHFNYVGSVFEPLASEVSQLMYFYDYKQTIHQNFFIFMVWVTLLASLVVIALFVFELVWYYQKYRFDNANNDDKVGRGSSALNKSICRKLKTSGA